MIKYFKPFYCEKPILDNIKKVLESGWTTTGKWVEELEDKWARLCKTKYAVAVNSASSGLHIAPLAHGLFSRTIGTTDYTYVATVMSLFLNNKVLMYDVDDSYCVDWTHIKKDINKLQAFVPVHIAGKKMDVKEMAKHRLVIEDCAHRFPSKHDGHTQVYSLHANKLLTCGEGGMITTNNKTIYESLLKLRYHGRDRIGNHKYNVTQIGYKYNMPDLLAAMILPQLDDIETQLQMRQDIAQKYIKAFSELGLRMQEFDKDHHYHLFLLRFADKKEREFVEKRISKHIEISRHYKPVSELQLFKKLDYENKSNAMKLYEETISLPIYPNLAKSEVNEVIGLVCEAVDKWRRKNK